MVYAIGKNLQEAGYTISNVEPVVDELEAHQKEAEFFVFYLGSFVSEISDVLVYLKDICLEQEKMLLVIGNPMELSTFEEYIPEAYITSKFERPLDVRKLVDELDRLLSE